MPDMTSGFEGLDTQYLSEEEDNELRRLNFLAQHAELSARSKERLLELRMRDRRAEVRPPREFEPKLHLSL